MNLTLVITGNVNTFLKSLYLLNNNILKNFECDSFVLLDNGNNNENNSIIINKIHNLLRNYVAEGNIKYLNVLCENDIINLLKPKIINFEIEKVIYTSIQYLVNYHIFDYKYFK